MNTRNSTRVLEGILKEMKQISMEVGRLMSLQQVLAGIERTPTIKPPEVSEREEELPFKPDIDRTFESFGKHIKNPEPLRPASESSPGSVVEGIIVDPLAFYVPYHHYPKEWGIYLRLHKIYNDFMSFLKQYYSAILKYSWRHALAGVFALYLGVIVMHEFQHHVIEDAATIRNNKSYPYFEDIRDEEALCEFYAFNFFSSIGDEWVNAILSTLYYHWNRANDPVYRPRITQNVANKLAEAPEWFVSESLNISIGFKKEDIQKLRNILEEYIEDIIYHFWDRWYRIRFPFEGVPPSAYLDTRIRKRIKSVLGFDLKCWIDLATKMVPLNNYIREPIPIYFTTY